MQHVALEGRCFVLSSCQMLLRADCPADYAAVQGNDPDTVLMRGGSCMPSAFAEMSVFGFTASSMHPMRPSPFRTFWSRSASSRTRARE